MVGFASQLSVAVATPVPVIVAELSPLQLIVTSAGIVGVGATLSITVTSKLHAVV